MAPRAVLLLNGEDVTHFLEPASDGRALAGVVAGFAPGENLLQLACGNADNQVIWFTDARPTRTFDQTPEAFEVIDEWMANIREHPERGVAGNKPARAVDRCFTTDGTEIAAGDDVWNGILDEGPPGVCTQRFPTFESTRIVAGGPIEGGIFKCGLQSIDHAISSGVYGPWAPTPAEVDRLEQIFPDGVCDWEQGDVGRPRD